MKTIKQFLLLILITSTSIFAQDKLLTLEDVVMRSRSSLATSNLEQLTWMS